MNFANMPELKWFNGYYMALGLIGGLCGYVYCAVQEVRLALTSG